MNTLDYDLGIHLCFSLAKESLEDCRWHPAEKILRDALHYDNIGETMTLLCSSDKIDTVLCKRNPAEIIKIIGRLDYDEVKDWIVPILKDALKNDDISIRDSAVMAIENFENKELFYLLKEHNESIDWLKDYINEIIQKDGYKGLKLREFAEKHGVDYKKQRDSTYLDTLTGKSNIRDDLDN